MPQQDEHAALKEAPEHLVSEQVELVAADGREEQLADAVREAAALFQASKGCRGFALEESIDQPGHLRLTILWETLDDHLVGFRQSDAFTRWRELVMPHLAEPPKAEHFTERFTAF